jgi:hypothetical protein
MAASGDLDIHLDLSLLPNHLGTDGCDDGLATQAVVEEVARNIIAHETHPSHHSFFDQPKRTLRLDHVREIYRKQNKAAALDLLRRRHDIDWLSSRHHIPVTDSNLVWSFYDHYVDSIVCVSMEPGLTTLIPPDRDHSFLLSLKFDQHQRALSPKYCKFGFDPQGSALYLGKYGEEQVWVAWATTESLTGADDSPEPCTPSGSTVMNVRHYGMTILFFAAMIEKLADRGIYITRKYPTSLTSITDIDAVTNLR